MQAYILPFNWMGQRSKHFFSENGHVAYQIFEHYASKMFDFMLTTDLLGWVRSKKVKRYIFIEKYLIMRTILVPYLQQGT